jgi:very-short-patch-repair endonuclease
MDVDEPGFPGKAGLRPQVWRVSQLGDGNPGKPGRSAEVCRVLQVSGTGDRGLAQVAAAQRALVHLSQLRELGITRGSYEHRVEAGSLHRVFPSVLSVVHPLVEPWAAETAALLYAGGNAVLSHETAAAVWGLAASPSFVAITLIGRKVESQPHLRLHRVKALDIRDVIIHKGFPVTAPARTLIDCATNTNIDRLLNEARALDLVTDGALTAAIARCPGRKGTGPLRRLLSDRYERGYTRSGAERRLRRLVKAGGLDPPTYNAYVLAFQVDAVWPQQRVVVEVDGYRFHGHREAFERDRKRDQRLIGAGYLVVRTTWRQLVQEPMAVAVAIAKALALRGC